MKKILILFIGILASMTIFAQEKNALVVKLTDGSTNTFVLSNKPVVTMPGNNVVISGVASATYSRSEVEKFYFIYDDGSGIESIGKDNIAFFYEDGENVRITGLKDKTTVSVASLDGKIISTQKSDGTGIVTISLGNHPKGIYIISVGGRSIKVRR
jgi:hypothetical protein